jgi:hypothetical protein
MFVCERHAGDVSRVEKALLASGEFPEGATLTGVATQELKATSFPARLAVATAE